MNIACLFNKIIVLMFTLVVFTSLQTFAAEQDNKDKRSKYKTKQSAAMSQPVYKKLQKAQEHIEAKEYTEALNILDKLRSSKKRRSNYERAQAWNVTAYVYYLEEKYKKAIDAYNEVLAQGEIPEALTQSTLKTVAQLHFVTENYQQALITIKKLIAVLNSPSADIYMLLGQAYFQLKQYDDALPEIEKAVALYRKQGKTPKENWLVLLRVIHHQNDDFKNMGLVLEELMELYPKDQYLRALAGVYSELGNTHKQLTMMELLYERNYKQTSGQILNLVNLYMLHGVPYKAAKVLHKAMEVTESVEPTESNYRLLSQAWYQAREDEKSIVPMIEAAKLSETGELYMRVAQSYMNLGMWNDAAEAINKGLKKGKLKRDDSAQLMLGMILFNQKKLELASKHFAIAQKDDRSKKTAGQWIAYVKEEIQRSELLNTGKMNLNN